MKAALHLFSDEIGRYLDAMEAGDGNALEALLTEARDFRKRLDE